jgi:hypothetical protein
MGAFLKFLLIFLYLEFGILVFAFLIEIYRLIFFSYSIENERSRILKRRVLHEISTIKKNSLCFDFNFFFYCVFFLNLFSDLF